MGKFSVVIILLTIFMAIPFQLSANEISIEQILFHKAFALEYPEDWYLDNGGVMFVFVRNNGEEPQNITVVKLDGKKLETLEAEGKIKWWHINPATIEPHSVSIITVKAVDSPIKEGETHEIFVKTASGKSDTKVGALRHPLLRIGWVVPTNDLRTIYLFLRNLDQDQAKGFYTIEQVGLNADCTERAIFISGRDIMPRSMGIIKVEFDKPLKLMTNLAVWVKAKRGSGEEIFVGAPIRLIKPHFPLGTWASSMYDEEKIDGQRYARKLQLDTCVGLGNTEKINRMGERYFIKALPAGKHQDVNFINVNKDNPNISCWMVRDEPELAKHPSSEVRDQNRIYWDLGVSQPTWINLCRNRQMNEYGHIADVAGVDHYTLFSAPNIIQGTWITRTAKMEESFEYVDNLKLNVEPKTFWVWAQLDMAFHLQDLPWGVNYQFWGSVMAGAKGIFWFVYQPGMEYDANDIIYLEEALSITREFSQIRNLVLYGDSMDLVNFNTPLVKGRAIIGEKAVVIIVINNNYHFLGAPFLPIYVINPADYELTFEVPAWIPMCQVYRVQPNGQKLIPPFSFSGRQIKISSQINERAHIYVIGDIDTSPPASPYNINIAEIYAGNSFIISWEEPFDNFGVAGYRILRESDGAMVAETRYPLLETGGLPDSTERFYFQAYDTEGNLSPLSHPLRYLQWNFNWNGYKERWTYAEDISDLQVKDGSMQILVNGNRPLLVSPYIKLNTSKYRYLRLVMRNQTSAESAELLWLRGGESGYCQHTFPISAFDQGFSEYVIDLGNITNWRGMVEELCLVPASGGNNGLVEIDLIEFRTESEGPIPTPAPSFTPSSTPTSIPTTTPTPTNTSTPTFTPSFTSTPLPSFTLTPMPPFNPRILMAGYMDTQLSSSYGGLMTIFAWCRFQKEKNPNSVEIYYQGKPTGIELERYDEKNNLYFLNVQVPAGIPSGKILLQLMPENENPGFLWPYLTISEN